MAIVIKTIHGRQYFYEQTSVRINGKVKTMSRYLGPVPKRDGIGFVVMGLLSLGVAALKGDLHDTKWTQNMKATEARERAYTHWLNHEQLTIPEMQEKARQGHKETAHEDEELMQMIREFEAYRAAEKAAKSASEEAPVVSSAETPTQPPEEVSAPAPDEGAPASDPPSVGEPSPSSFEA